MTPIAPLPWSRHEATTGVVYRDDNGAVVSFPQNHEYIHHCVSWHERLKNNLAAALTFIQDEGFKARVERMLTEIEKEPS